VSTWTRNIADTIVNNKKGDEKMAEETTPKPAVEKTEAPKPAVTAPKKPAERNPEVIFIGNKPPMSYVMAVITAMSSGTVNEITLKARGKAITTAVDVAEITTNRFMKDLKVTAIGIGTEEMPPREGDNRARMVSTMEIKLTKQ
jgi:DNA-binding protein